MAGQIHVGDVGTTLRVTVTENGQPFDLSSATVKTMKLKKPDGTVIPKTAAFETTGANGVLIYVTVAGDITVHGIWKGQVFVTMPTGSWHTATFSFQVSDHF